MCLDTSIIWGALFGIFKLKYKLKKTTEIISMQLIFSIQICYLSPSNVNSVPTKPES